jgi:ABC-type multidrug transport system ATPase subunit
MQINLSAAGKRFNREWIFRNCTIQFNQGDTYAIIGPNGSGKSTLLQIVAGSMALSAGNIHWQQDQSAIAPENVFDQISIAAPYLELIEEMTAYEFLQFHQGFKPLLDHVSIEGILQEIGLEKAAHKQIRYYSSGMKQRVKLAQAIFSRSSTLLLDEPCTNLDRTGIELYQNLIEKYRSGRTVIVSSNDQAEYEFCKTLISINDYK